MFLSYFMIGDDLQHFTTVFPPTLFPYHVFRHTHIVVRLSGILTIMIMNHFRSKMIGMPVVSCWCQAVPGALICEGDSFAENEVGSDHKARGPC